MNSHPLRPTRRSLLFTGVLYHNLKKYSNELVVNYEQGEIIASHVRLVSGRLSKRNRGAKGGCRISKKSVDFLYTWMYNVFAINLRVIMR